MRIGGWRASLPFKGRSRRLVRIESGHDGGDAGERCYGGVLCASAAAGNCRCSRGEAGGWSELKAGTMAEMLESDATVEFYAHRRLEGIAAVQGARQEVGSS